MYYYFEKNNKEYIYFYRLKSETKHEKVTRRLYHCKKTAYHSAQYIIIDGRKFYINDNCLNHKVLN